MLLICYLLLWIWRVEYSEAHLYLVFLNGLTISTRLRNINLKFWGSMNRTSYFNSHLPPPTDLQRLMCVLCPILLPLHLRNKILWATFLPLNPTPNIFFTSLPSPQEVSKFKCEKCEKPFVNSFMLKNHMRYRHGEWVTG